MLIFLHRKIPLHQITNHLHHPRRSIIMYARWVPPSAGGFTPSAPATNQSKANESSHNHNRNYHQHGNYNDYEAESQEPEEVMTQEQEQEEKPLSATNGFGYSRWTPGGATIAGATAPVVGKKALIRRRQVSESESSSSSESSSEESSSDEESDEEEAKVVKRKREEVVDGPEVKKVRVESESGDPSESEGASDNASSSDDSSDSESDSEVPVNRIPEPTTDAMDIDSPAPGEAKATKKPPKKEKGKKSPINPYSDSDLKEAPSKHKSTLDRKTKSLQLAATLPESATTAAPHSSDSDTEKHGLEPLPQPEVLEDLSTVVPSFETLPPWLAAPIRVSATNMADWKILCLSETPARILAGKGYKEAFAVQTAVIPLLTGSAREVQGDVLVQAATGSGKTMAYAVPVVRELSEGVVTRLRALVVLPTRELVRQAAEAFEICAGAFEGEGKRVRIGVAVGNQSLKYEQSVLVERRERFGGRESEDVDVEAEAEEEEERRRAEVGAEFMSRVDVLICTPGRLVDHLRHTPGFDLTYVRWLIVDEADKLLAQSFQGWLDLLTARLTATAGVFSARDHPGGALEGVRKVVLSATLTRDLSLLGGLGLRRPRLVVLEGGKGGEEGLQHVLPEGLTERVVRIRDAALKPLYLVDVLRRLARERMWKGKVEKAEEKKKEEVEAEDNSKSESESESNSSSDSDPVSDSDSDSDSDSSPATPHPPKLSTYLTPKTFRSTVLIFTKSNESALRLTHLLTLLLPSLTPLISTLTSSTPSSHRRRLLSSFTARTHRILVASDLVARGIDVPSLNHVINYDLPASLPGYVHRVGRTARAGRDGVAWTLLPDNESGWFWGRIAKAKDVGRANKVERIRVGDEQGELPEAEVARYEEALAELGWVARGRQ